ncbi:hypothetical protein TcCL_ESM11145 [Trypanosoma cruzi]|nr:hypothetical protein TcCL_ESM11145 [Trypanosoma cruzi]
MSLHFCLSSSQETLRVSVNSLLLVLYLPVLALEGPVISLVTLHANQHQSLTDPLGKIRNFCQPHQNQHHHQQQQQPRQTVDASNGYGHPQRHAHRPSPDGGIPSRQTHSHRLLSSC